jgi:hypothetical protein
MDDLIELNKGLNFLDADTVRDEYGPVRFQNLWAPEVQHLTKEGLKPAEWGGEFLKDLYSRLARETGYINVYRSGDKGKYRDLGDLQNEDQQSYTNRLIYEGLAYPTNVSQKELYDMGFFSRAFAKEVEGVEDSPWERAREEKRQYEMATAAGWKGLATDEQELKAANDYYGKTYSPYESYRVRFRNFDRNFENEAKSNLFTGWTSGFGSIKESAQEAISVFGDIIGSEDLYESGQAGARAQAYEMGKLPTFANDIMRVDSLSSMGNYMAGMMGQAAPYMLGLGGTLLAGAAAATFGAPLWASALIGLGPACWVYAGETYGNMEGGVDQKNAGIAIGAGLGMCLLDRLALGSLLKPSVTLKKDGLKQVAEMYAKENNIPLEEAMKKVISESGNLSIGALRDISNFATLQINKALLAKTVGLGTLRGTLVESSAEGLQESLGYLGGVLGSEREFDAAEYRHIVINAIAGGGLLGGGISAVGSATSSVGGFKKIQRMISSVNNNEDYIGGQMDDNLKQILAETNIDPNSKTQAARDWNKERDEEVAKGALLDLSKIRGGTKSIYRAIKEFPSLFVQKTGARWQKRIMDNPNVSDKAKKIFATIATIAGQAKESFMQGLDLFNTKRILMMGLIAEVEQLQSDLNTLFGVGIGGMKSKEAIKSFVNYLNDKSDGKGIEPRFAHLEEQLADLAERIGGQKEGSQGITDKLLDIINALEEGSQTKKKPGWFQNSGRLNINEVSKDKKGFVKALMDKKWSKTDAEAFWDVLINGPQGYDKSQLEELGFRSFKARSLKQNKGVLNAVFGDDSKFLENDPFQRLKENIQEQVNYAVDKKYIGKDGENMSKMLMLLKDEMGADWDPRIATQFMDNIAAGRGDYRRMKNKWLERMIGHITFSNTFIHLSLSTLASLPEAAIVLLNIRNDKGILDSIKKGVKDLGKHYSMHGKDAWSYINPKSGVTRDEYIRNVVDFYRYGYATGKHGAIGQVGIDEAVYKTSKIKERFMKAFFFVNGLKLYTDATRVARLSLANDAIFGDLEIIGFALNQDKQSNYYGKSDRSSSIRNSGLFQDAFSRLRELNIDPDMASEQYYSVTQRVRKNLGSAFDSMSPEEVYENLINTDSKFLDTMDIARMTFVDNAIAHPEAMNRPLWYSNPHYRLFTQYNGFMSVFTAHILPKIWKKVKGADPTAKYNAVAVMATMIAMGFISQMLKDEWKYDGRPGWLSDKGYIQRGIVSSGLIGTPEKFLDAISPLYDTGYKSITGHVLDATEGFLGPTFQRGKNFQRIFMAQLEGNEELRNKYLAKEIPILGTEKGFKDWFVEQAK